jgi:hypothetical protein
LERTVPAPRADARHATAILHGAHSTGSLGRANQFNRWTPMNVLGLAILLLANVWTHVPRSEQWSPDAAVIRRLQSTLESKVRKDASAQHLVLPEWSSYGFQFQGRVVDGKRVVFVSAYCQHQEGLPTDDFIIVADGGTCFFETSYDPSKSSFSPIAFHGLG